MVSVSVPVPQSLGRVVVTTGGDDTALLNSEYQKCPVGGTLYLRPSATTGRFVHSGTLDWTGRNVSIDGPGCELYAGFAYSGTQASVTWGAAPGSEQSGAYWNGLAVIGALAVQNIDHNAGNFHCPSVGTLILQANKGHLMQAYFYVGSANGGYGDGSGVIINQINSDDWCNRVGVIGCAICGQPATPGAKPQPAIWQSNQTAVYGPLLLFRDCDFEGSSQTLINLAPNASLTFDQCYAEGDWVEGPGSGQQGITWHDMPLKWCDWLKDVRNTGGPIFQ
jgi:hypothetical protein